MGGTGTPRPGTRPLWRSAVLGVVAGLAVAFVGEAIRVLALGNFHAVLPGRVYRCAQPSPAELEALIKSHGIRTVINLRGSCPNFDWYRNQCRVANRFDVAHEDVSHSDTAHGDSHDDVPHGDGN